MCQKCKAMPRALDCLCACCAEDAAPKAKKDALQWITLHEEFDLVCLECAVLDVALTGYFEMHCDVDD